MDKELVKKYAEKYADIKELFEKHQEIEAKLNKLSKRPYLNPEEEQEEKFLKKEKLRLKEEIAALLKKYEGITID